VSEAGSDSDAGHEAVNELWVVRHGQTEWALAKRHTGLTDVPLTAVGEDGARALAPVLAAVAFDRVVCSPLQRARRTAQLAGFADAEVDPRAVEWDYGDYEGLTRAEISRWVPDWRPFEHPQMPGGENLADVAARADALLKDLMDGDAGRVLLVAHAHFLRVLTARWLGQPPELAAHLVLDPATVSVLGEDRGTHAVLRWNAPPA
jgi:broad specificity phosphatase PhoE